MAKKLKMEFVSTDGFVGFLNKFITIDSNALLEIRTNNTMVIKSYTASRSAVKMGTIVLDDIFEINDGDITDNVKVGIYSLEKLIKLFSYIDSNDDVVMEIDYSKDNDGDYYAKTIHINTKLGNKKFPCANKTLFKYMDDNTADVVFNIENNLFNLTLDQATLTRIQNFASLEPSSELSFCAYSKNGKQVVDFKGKTYKIPYMDTFEINEETEKASISKEYLKYTDKEDYKVYVTTAAILFISNDDTTKIALGRLPDDDFEEEEISDEASIEETIEGI